jgi:hypothetical protein
LKDFLLDLLVEGSEVGADVMWEREEKLEKFPGDETTAAVEAESWSTQ